jgi:type II secretion system protein G
LNQRGFTLVELLVVIVILSIVASVVAFSILGSVRKARIAERVNDLKSIQSALELYRIDYGQYPTTQPNPLHPAWGYSVGICYGDNMSTVLPSFIPKYLSKFPIDPNFNPNAQCDSTTNYPNSTWYTSNGADYKVQFYNMTDMLQSDYAQYPQYVDPVYDGGPYDNQYYYPDPNQSDIVGHPHLTSCDGLNDGTFYSGWAVYSPNYRCAP